MSDPPGAGMVTHSIEAVTWERTDGRGGWGTQGQAWGGGLDSSCGRSQTSVHVLDMGRTPALAACWGSLQTRHAEVEAGSGSRRWTGGGAPGATGFLSPCPSSDARGPWAPCQTNPSPLRRAITLENTLVILSTVAPDAGRYYVQAVNDKNGDNKTSQPITLAVESK